MIPNTCANLAFGTPCPSGAKSRLAGSACLLIAKTVEYGGTVLNWNWGLPTTNTGAKRTYVGGGGGLMRHYSATIYHDTRFRVSVGILILLI